MRGTRWTKGWLAAAVTLSALACFKSPAKKAAEVRECSRITMDAQGATQCLVLQYKWKQAAALAAATKYQQEQDLIAQLHADSTWKAEAARHRKEVTDCARDPSGDVARCLDRKSTRLNSSHSQISYAVFCLKKKKHKIR